MSIDYPRALLAALGLIVGVAVVVAASTSGAAFGLYNPAWDGAADLRGLAEDAGTEPTVVRNASAYGRVPTEGTVALVLAPAEGYGPAEAAGVRAFVEGGGTLVVADDVDGPANALLADVGAEARLDGRRLRDEQHYYRGPALPVADDVGDHAYTQDVDALTLNHGTAVVPGGATPIVRTSGVAYLDGNGNEAPDDDEPIGPFPVATVEAVGDGRVVVVSDPSAFVNAMLDRPGNRAFATALVSSHDRVLLDYSHAGALPPLAAALLSIRGSTLLQELLGGLVVGAVGLWAGWPSIRRSPRVRRLLEQVSGRS
ncbi:MAG TPA: DUF4350 domain-containing protein, partial [Halobacteriales archaeon]|nr:DUF4350 domain-containing protein [Halobacteriales archaeon]